MWHDSRNSWSYLSCRGCRTRNVFTKNWLNHRCEDCYRIRISSWKNSSWWFRTWINRNRIICCIEWHLLIHYQRIAVRKGLIDLRLFGGWRNFRFPFLRSLEEIPHLTQGFWLHSTPGGRLFGIESSARLLGAFSLLFSSDKVEFSAWSWSVANSYWASIPIRISSASSVIGIGKFGP